MTPIEPYCIWALYNLKSKLLSVDPTSSLTWLLNFAKVNDHYFTVVECPKWCNACDLKGECTEEIDDNDWSRSYDSEGGDLPSRKPFDLGLETLDFGLNSNSTLYIKFYREPNKRWKQQIWGTILRTILGWSIGKTGAFVLNHWPADPHSRRKLILLLDYIHTELGSLELKPVYDNSRPYHVYNRNGDMV